MPDGIVIIDKSPDWTSHDVVAKLRGILREKRIGHAGTLDPMATGVLPVFVGRGTRAVEFAAVGDKEYLATMRLGITTDTQDTTGTVLTQSTPAVSDSALDAALALFRGEISQIPPMYSAIKVQGKKLYELARKGQEIARTPRAVTIRALTMQGREGNDVFLRVRCSKGTYIRTLCHDIGQHLGCGAAMSALRRTMAAGFTLSQAVSLENVQQLADAGNFDAFFHPVDLCFRDYPSLSCTEEQEMRFIRNGARFPLAHPDGTYRVYNESGAFLMLGKLENGQMQTIKSFYVL